MDFDLYPDEEEVEKIFNDIEKYFSENKAIVINALTALSALLICKCNDIGISKPKLLGYISNSWELNDPEADFPNKGDYPSFQY